MKAARLSFAQGWALRQLARQSGPVSLFRFTYGRDGDGWAWPERSPWFERGTLAALTRRGLAVVGADRTVAISDKGRAALRAWLELIERRSHGG